MKTKPKVLQVVQMGQPVLREKAKSVSHIKSETVRQIIDNLLVTCEDFDGVGISAPQIDESLRIMIIASKPNTRYPKAPLVKPIVMINPIVAVRSIQTETDWEGCLSIPGLRGLVKRDIWLKVIYQDRNGIQKKKTLRGFLARIFQHELDHLNGVLFIDRADPKTMMTEKEYLRLMKKK